MRRRLADQQRMIEFHACLRNSRFAPIARVREQGIVKNSFLAQFQPGVAGLPLEAAANAVGLDTGLAQQ